MTLEEVTEELMEKATINFPKEISLPEAEKLIKYIVKEFPANIKYDLSTHKSISYNFDKKIVKNCRTSEINCDINTFGKFRAFDSFKFTKSGKYSSKFTNIEFQTIHGYGLSKYGPEIKQIWDEVRKVVDNYFSNNSK